jgi:diamine N-acetyltransferase
MREDQVFHTNSLILRPVSLSDARTIFEWENDRENWIQSGINKPYKLEEIEQYAIKNEQLIVDGQTRFMIDRNSEETIGCIDLFDYDKVKQMATVGLLIDRKYREKGYGSESLSAIAQISKKIFSLSTLKALILAENEISWRLFKKNGFITDDTKAQIYTYEGVDYLQLAYFKQL